MSLVTNNVGPIKSLLSGSSVAPVLNSNFPKPASINTEVSTSYFRHIFKPESQLQNEFVKFLKTIFYQLDDKKVLVQMNKILEDPQKTDEAIYKELVANIHKMKKTGSFLYRLWSLFVLKNGMGQQAAELTKAFQKHKFHDYMEIYDRRYVKSIRKTTKMPLDKNVVAVCDSPTVGIGERIQAAALFSRYPYKTHIALNDKDCQNPLEQPQKTHKPIGDEVADNSMDMICAVGGLHHIPNKRLHAFVDSLNSKLRPGAVILLRDHDISNSGVAGLPAGDIKAIASLVHTFVNAADNVSWEVEKGEVRKFNSLDAWTQLMERKGFTRISPKGLVLKDDPTENAMIAFVKTPKNLEEMKQAIAYRNDCTRPKEGTRATWVEWGNVRSSKQYAEFIQNHHEYAFDFIGHIRQHWKHMYMFLKESLNDKEIKFKDVVFSDNMVMNVFITLAATVQYSIGAVTNLPSIMCARWKHGKNWRNVANLTAYEKFQAKNELEYSNFIDHTPFYSYPYASKIKEMWKAIWTSSDSFFTKLTSSVSAVAATASFLVKSIACAPIRGFYTSEAIQEPDTIKMLIKDKEDELNKVIKEWNQIRDNENQKIEVIYTSKEGHKLVSIPRYRPFTKICGILKKTRKLEILEIGSQKEISVDVFVKKGFNSPEIKGARIVYELDKLQDQEQRRYVTYQVQVSALKAFQQKIASQRQTIEYVHE